MNTEIPILIEGFRLKELVLLVFGLGLITAGFFSLRKGRTVTGPRTCSLSEQPVAFWLCLILAYWGMGVLCVSLSVVYALQNIGALAR